MGLFDQLLGSIIGQLGSGQQRNMLLDLATRVIQSHPGGLAGILEQFKAAGLGQQAGSWVGTGANLPISAEQLMSVLGRENVQAMGEKLGVPAETASAGLASLLPAIIDQLTPKGQVESGTDLASALTALRGKLKA